MTSAQLYADQAEVDAVTTANAYTDAEVVTINTTLSGKADTAHTHLIADVTDYDRTDGVVLSETAPGSPTEGLKWIETTTMIEYVYYNSTWIEI